MSRKLRIFYVAWTPPSENGGACLAMRRHLIEHDDFDLFVVTSAPFSHPTVPHLRIKRHPAIVRLSNTRFSRWVRQFEMAFESAKIPREMLEAAQKFKPDVVFTVADNTLSWLDCLSSGEKIGDSPGNQFSGLVAAWTIYFGPGEAICLGNAIFGTPLSPDVSDQQSGLLHQPAGMREKLGNHPQAPVLYPCSALRDPNFAPDFVPPTGSRPLKLIYAGTIIRDYGRSVLRLAKALENLSWIKFEVYGPPPDWSETDLSWMKSQGIYRGLLPYSELKMRLREADACLVVMSFGRELELMMRTSFTTKFLEYVQFAKPVLVWGPEYCQPVRVAKETGAGLAVETDEVGMVVQALETLRSPECWLERAQGAWSAANGIFSHERIHQVFRESIVQAVAESSKGD